MTAPGEWLTIPEVCAVLRITPDQWAAWHEEPGDVPLQLITSDGARRVRAADLERWLDARTVEPLDDLDDDDIAEWHAMRDSADGGQGDRQ
jgi:hypothetical protein